MCTNEGIIHTTSSFYPVLQPPVMTNTTIYMTDKSLMCNIDGKGDGGWEERVGEEGGGMERRVREGVERREGEQERRGKRERERGKERKGKRERGRDKERRRKRGRERGGGGERRRGEEGGGRRGEEEGRGHKKK